MFDKTDFLGYAEILFDFLVLAETYWPVTVMVAMYFTMYKTWSYYLAVMHLKEERDKLKSEGKDFTVEQKVFGYPTLIIGLGWDILLNFLVGSIMFLELPRYDLKEYLFTGRVSRWNDTGGWRGDLARWFCRHYLDPFERGGHCS